MADEFYKVGQRVESRDVTGRWTPGTVVRATAHALDVHCDDGLRYAAIRGTGDAADMRIVGRTTSLRPLAASPPAAPADWRDAYPVGSDVEVFDERYGWMWATVTRWSAIGIVAAQKNAAGAEFVIWERSRSSEVRPRQPAPAVRPPQAGDVYRLPHADGRMMTWRLMASLSGLLSAPVTREIAPPPCPFCSHALHAAHTVAVLRCEACGWAGSEAQRAKAAEPARPESPFKVGDWVRPAAEDIASADARTPRLHESVVGQVVALGEQNGRETVRIVWRSLERDTALFCADDVTRAERPA